MNRTAGFVETFNFFRWSRRMKPYVCIVGDKVYDWGESEEDARRRASETAAAEGDMPQGKISFKPASALTIAVLQEFWPDIPIEFFIETGGDEVYVTDDS